MEGRLAELVPVDAGAHPAWTSGDGFGAPAEGKLFMMRRSSLAACASALALTAGAAAAQVSVSIDDAPDQVAPGETYSVSWTVRSPDPVDLTAVVWGTTPGEWDQVGERLDGPPGQFTTRLTAPSRAGATVHYVVYVATGQTQGVIAERTIAVTQPTPTPPPATGGDVTLTSDPGLAIPDASNAGARDRIAVAEPGTVRGLTVGVDLRHPWRGDLVLRLTSPAGTRVTLFEGGENDSGDDLSGTFGADLRPAEPLSAFAGEPARGGWTLEVVDRQQEDTGVLASWTLSLDLDGQAPPPPAPDLFADVTAAAGLGEMSYGASIGDMDGDGDLDVLGTRIFANQGRLRFDRRARPDLDEGDTLLGSKIADVDNDGDLDLFLVGDRGVRNRFYENRGGLRFVERTAAAGLESTKKSRGACFGDVDGDGFVDLYVCVADGEDLLYRNDGDGTFTEVARQAGVANDRYAMASAMADYDADGDLDIYVVNAPDPSGSNARNLLFENDGSGRFTDVAARAGVAGADDHDGYGLAWGDLDGDGHLDLHVVNFGGSRRNYLFHNRGDGTFEEVALRLGLDNGFEEDNCVTLGDFDNDGDLDIYLSSFGPTRYYENLGGLRFEEKAEAVGFGDVRGFNSATGDLDGDGDLDLYDSGTLYEGRGSRSGHHWLQVALEGTASNRDAIGARLTARAGGLTIVREVSGGQGYNATDAFRQHFGLGRATRVDELVVRWPSGQVETFRDVPADQLLRLREPRRPAPPPTGGPSPGTIETLAGDGGGAPVPGRTFPADASLGGRTWGVARDSSGRTFFGLFDGDAIARLNDDGTATLVMTGLDFPMVFDFAPNDDLLLADQGASRVVLATEASGYRDVRTLLGPQTVSGPGAARYGPNGKIYVADTGNHRIIEVEPDLSGARVVAGGRQGLAGDGGPATRAALNFPIDMDVDARGGLVIADSVNNRLRAVNLNATGTLTVGGVRVAAGEIETIAGVGQAGSRTTRSWEDARAFGGFSGDGGPATRARIDWPFSPRFDSGGRIWFADADNHRIRSIAPDGTITTHVGSARLPQENGFRFIGSRGRDVADGGPADRGDLNRPMDLEVVEEAGGFTLLIGDTDNNRVRIVRGLRLAGATGPAPDRRAPTFAGVTSVRAGGTDTLSVGWSPATDDRSDAAAIRYDVFVARASGGQDLARPTLTTPPGATRATVRGLQPGTRYHVVVRARDAAGNADGNTRELSAVTERPQPQPDRRAPSFAGVRSVAADGETAIVVRWSPADDDRSPAQAIRYLVFVADAPGGQDFQRPTATTSPGATEATIGGLQPGTRYHVVVRARDEAGNTDTNRRERSAETDAPQPRPVTFSRDVLPIFAARCTACHTPGGQGPFSLEDGVAHGNIVGRASFQVPTMNRVEPGDPARSYLLHKLRGTHRSVGGSGQRMPRVGPPLSSDQTEVIRRWIEQGAPND